MAEAAAIEVFVFRTASDAATRRQLLRSVVADRLGPDRFEITYCCAVCAGPHGKPFVQLASGGPAPQVSVSSSGAVALVAVGAVPVGVDVQQCAATGFAGFDAVALAPAERAELAPTRTPELRAELWVRKEAVLKISGLGLSVPPSEVPVGRVSEGSVAVPEPVAPGGWASVAAVPVPDGYRGAVAVAGRRRPSVITRDGSAWLASRAAAARTATG